MIMAVLCWAATTAQDYEDDYLDDEYEDVEELNEANYQPSKTGGISLRSFHNGAWDVYKTSSQYYDTEN